MDEGKIIIQKKGGSVRIAVRELELTECLNLLLNAMNDVIEETVSEPAERTALVALMCTSFVRRFQKAEKDNDQV